MTREELIYALLRSFKREEITIEDAVKAIKNLLEHWSVKKLKK